MYQPLTRWERQLVEFLADDLTLEEIAERPAEPLPGIEAEVAEIMAKLDVQDASQVVYASIRRSGQPAPEHIAATVDAVRARVADLPPSERHLLLACAGSGTIESLMARLGVGGPAEAIRLGLWAGLHRLSLDDDELEVLRHAVLGDSAEQCFAEFGLTSLNAVYERRTAIFTKLGPRPGPDQRRRRRHTSGPAPPRARVRGAPRSAIWH